MNERYKTYSEKSPKSNGLIHMDMNVYNEDEEILDDSEDEVSDQSSHLISANNLSDDSDTSENNQKQGRKMSSKLNVFQKENLIEKANTEQGKYILKCRRNSSKVETLTLPLETKKSKKSYARSEGNETFSSKSDLIKYKEKKNNFKCSGCEKGFCSKDLLQQHSIKCKHKSRNDWETCKIYFKDKKHFDDSSVIDEVVCYKCEKCSRLFNDKIQLKSHVVQNQCKSINFYKCDFCQQTFIHKTELREHITAHLDSQFNDQKDSRKKNSCHICNKPFLNTEQLKIHLLAHQGIFKCKTCRKSFPSQELLDDHTNNGYCLSLFIRKCMKCNKLYKDDVRFQQHLKTHEDNKCRKCKKVFLDPIKLSEHVSNGCYSEPQKKYECGICERKYVKLPSLEVHLLNAHHGIKYECKKCQMKFPSQEELDDHGLKGECKPEDPYTCNFCGKVFPKKDYLKKHENKHKNTIFKCKYCYCIFVKEKTYNKHMEKMNCSKTAREVKVAEFNYKKCRLCEIEYENEKTLIEHFRRTHPGQEPHQCFYCESCLPTFQDLQSHIHYHNVQKYSCKICGKPYTSQEGSRKHRLKHKVTELKCRYCNVRFLTENRLKIHEKTCKKNPETGCKPFQNEENQETEPENQTKRQKQSRQLQWESRIIVKRLRGDPKSSTDIPSGSGQENSVASILFDESENDSPNERGWFDNYYRTDEDDIAFGLKKDVDQQERDSNPDASEFLQTNSSTRVEGTNPTAIPDVDDERHENEEDNSSETSSAESTNFSSDGEITEEIDLPNYNPKKCRLCFITFNLECELLHHFVKIHPPQVAHECPNCGVRRPLFARLMDHMKTHGIGLGIFYCDNCSKKFKSEEKMKAHNLRCKGLIKAGTSSIKKTCKKCGKTFGTKSNYKRHKKNCKKKRVKSENLKQVSSKLKDKQEITDLHDRNDSHVSDQEEDVPKARSKTPETEDKDPPKINDSYSEEPPLDSFPCRLCDKKFQYERGIVVHFKLAHPGNKPLVCHVCNLHLADKLKEHLKTHGIGEEFICELCGKRFNQKFLSKIHELWHQGIEYKCTYCKQKFLNKEKMDKHVEENRCMNRESLMKLPCNICGKLYRSKFGLGKHHITHMPKELRPVKYRMNCEYCGKGFDNNNGLERHRRIHTGEKPYRCRFCPKAFAQEGNCREHEKIHTGDLKPRRKKVPAVVSQDVLPPPPPAASVPKPEPESEPDLELEPQPQIYLQPQIQVQTQPQIEVQTQPQIEVQTQPQIEVQTQPQIEVQTQPQIEVQTQPQIEVQTQPQIEVQTQPQIEVQTQPQIEVQSQPQIPTQTQPQIQVQPQPQLQIQPQSQIQIQTQPQIHVQTQPQIPIQPQHQIQIQAQPQIHVQTYPQIHVQTHPHIPIQTHPQIPIQTHPQIPIQTHTEQPIQTHPEQPIQTHPQIPIQTHPEQPIQTHPEQPMQTHPQIPIQTHPQMPIQTHPQMPIQTHPQMPIQTHPQIPIQTHPQIPIQTHPHIPIQTHPQIPIQTHPEIPFQSHPEIPFQTHSELPFQSHPEIPFQTHSEIPFQTHSEIPFQTHPQFQVHPQQITQFTWDALPYPGQINLYLYTTIDPSGIVQ